MTPDSPFTHFITDMPSGIPFLVAQSVFLGCLLFMFLLTLLQFSSNYARGYLYYALFILSSFLVFFGAFEHFSEIQFLPFSLHPLAFLQDPITAVALIFYLLFVSCFLEVKKLQPLFQRFIERSVWLLTAILVCDLITDFLWPEVFNGPFFRWSVRAIQAGVLITSLVLVYFNPNRLSRFISIGTWCVVLGLGSAGVLTVLPSIQSPPFLLPLHLAEAGVLLEILCFSVGMGHKSRETEKEKEQAQQQLIDQLRENHNLQVKMKEELEMQVKNRTDEIVRVNKMVDAQRFHQMRSELEKRIVETEMAALRAQMNPHFIFNCLNSINRFILLNEQETASDYLTKFSRLIRMVLDNSRARMVTLENELTALRLYIEMEALRFANKFGYEIYVEENIDTETTEIPPMLLQPYVENAIWHGLMQYNGDGKITISFQQQNNILIATIDDNGIGRDLARRLKSKSATERKSLGMKMTAERIEMINRIYDTNARVQIIDKVGNTGVAFGTTVKIEIPLGKQNEERTP